IGNKDSGSNGHTYSYIHAVKRRTQFHNIEDDNKPTIVLDESCLNQKDYSTAVMGKVKEFSSLTNLKIVLANEGFENIKLRYMGGYWVMIEFLNKDSENKFNTNVGTRSWLSHLQQASSTFHIDEIVTWVDIEGKVFWIRAKEVSGWVPDFVEDEEEDSDSEDGSIEEGPYSENVDKHEEVNSEEGDVEKVSETIFEKEQDQVPKEDNFYIGENGCNSEDPFNICSLLNKKTPMILKGVGKEGDETLKNDQEDKQNSKVRNPSSINNCKEDKEESICSGHFPKIDTPYSGGFMLQFMKDLVKVGQAMGGEWIFNGKKMLIICIYAPQELSKRKLLWDYLIFVIDNWNGEVVIMGDFNESALQLKDMDLFSMFKVIMLLTRSFRLRVWKRSLRAVVLLRGVIKTTWSEIQTTDTNDILKFMKKMKCLKEKIRAWIKIKKEKSYIQKKNLKADLAEIDLLLDKGVSRLHHNIEFHNKLTMDQKTDLKCDITRDEIKRAVWDYGIDKSPSPDGLSFGFYCWYWNFLEKCVEQAVRYFFLHGTFPKGGNSSFIALIPKTQNANMKKPTMIFKVDFEKAYDSVRWDYLDDVLKNFGFGDKWRGWIKNCTSIQPTHLFYTDDAVFMGQWSDSNIETIVHVLECFHRASGLRINMNKSKIMGIYVAKSIVEQAATKIGCAILIVPFSYLGSKINLAKKPIWIKWDKALAPKEKGGLGVSSLYALNRALLFKWVWRFQTQKTSIWTKVIKGIHGVDGNLNKNVKYNHPSIWLDIVKESIHLRNQGTDLRDFIQKKIGNGSDTSFWEEMWRGDSIFKLLYPRLYSLKTCKSITVAYKLGHENLVYSFRRHPRGGEFSVASMRKLIDDSYLPNVSSKTRWINVAPIKINIHAWKVKLDCLPTGLNISRRDGPCRKSNTDEVLGKYWDRVNVVVLGLILNSIYGKLFWVKCFQKEINIILKEFKETNDKVDGSVTFSLHHKIHTSRQNGSSIADYYYHRLNALWKQFEALIELPRSNYRATRDFKKHNQLMKLMQFLMGLDDTYMQIRSSILSRKTFPDVRSAYAPISSEESHGVASGSIVGSSQRNQASAFGSNVRSNNTPRPNNVNNNILGGGYRIKVRHPNGAEAFIFKIGNLGLSNGLILYDVLIIPEYCVTLISVRNLAKV
nr:RNA-directed DNA polymerase, eukaryota, reverse transcriptase zinc-binding domain protein [Tanacetum cinerariifolium]